MKVLRNITVFGLMALLMVSAVEAKDKVANRSGGSSNYVDSSGTFDGNQIYADVTNNGLFLDYHISGDSAMEWPKGTGVHSIFQSALWLGATVNGETRVSIGDYTQDMGPGPWGGDPLSAVHRIYKIEKSMLASPGDFADFQDWPVDFGAPWVDVDGDGVYTPMPTGTDHPQFVGDQVLWFVSNDGDPAYKLNMGTSPLDLEVQTTMFGFDRPDVFGDMVFLKQLVINRGSNTLTDTYMGLWSDPDLGYAGDDFVGCNVPLGVGYVWNDGDDSQYTTLSVGTPAAGYDFFQGPMVDCDTGEDCSLGAKMFGIRHPGKKNLSMSSFAFYINGDATYTDPSDEIEGYYYMQGLRKDGSAFPNAIAGDDYNQKFCFYGDPAVAHSTTNPVDGNYTPSADRRFLMNVGPFTMAPGDSQEVVFGIFHAAGGGALASVAYLMEVDALAQTAYDIDFALPDSPPAPSVQATALADQVILVWGAEPESYNVSSEVDVDAAGNPTNFVFEGYNVYQAETNSGAGKRKRLATYDLVNGITEIYDNVFNAELGETINIRTQFGSDSGLEHYHSITGDGLNNNSKLITNREYYFTVTAYGYNADGIPKTLESSARFLSVRPEVPNTYSAGENTASSGDSFTAAHTGPSQGSVDVVVINPADLTGDSYTLTMDDAMPDGTVAVNWTITNDASGTILVANNPVVGGVNTATGVVVGPGGTPVVEGFQVLVNGPQENLLSVSEWDHGWKENSVLRDPAVSYVPWASLGRTGYILENRAGCAYCQPYTRDFDRFNYWESDDVELDFSTPSLGWEYYDEYVNGYMPFSAFRHNFATGNKEQLYAGWWDSNYDGVLTNNGAADWDGPIYGGGNGAYEPLYIHAGYDVDGDGAVNHYDPALEAQYIATDFLMGSGGCGFGYYCPGAVTTSGADINYPYMTATLFVAYFAGVPLPDAAGHTAWGSGWTTASSVVFEMSKPNSSADTFNFSTDGLGVVANAYDPDRIKVWPNPYYGYNPEERDALDRRVMFTHLPEEGPATIRIFALDGTLIRVLHHNDAGSQHATWDMKNDFELPVASGMYVAHIETNFGDKILKLAVIQPEQRLDVY